jgi:hypothetical protein
LTEASYISLQRVSSAMEYAWGSAIVLDQRRIHRLKEEADQIEKIQLWLPLRTLLKGIGIYI